MAENQDKEKRTKKDSNDNENDPFNFFKFEGPKKNSNKDDDDKNKKKNPFSLFFTILAISLLVMIVLNFISSQRTGGRIIDYSEFKNKISSGEIVEVVIGENYLIGYSNLFLSEDDDAKGIKLSGVKESRTQYKTTAIITQKLLDLLDEKNVKYKVAEKSNNYFLQLLINLIIPFGIIFLLYFFLFRKMGGGGGGVGSIFTVGNSRAKVVGEGKIKTRFADVAGVDEAKEELVEVVDFLK